MVNQGLVNAPVIAADGTLHRSIRLGEGPGSTDAQGTDAQGSNDGRVPQGWLQHARRLLLAAKASPALRDASTGEAQEIYLKDTLTGTTIAFTGKAGK